MQQDRPSDMDPETEREILDQLRREVESRRLHSGPPVPPIWPPAPPEPGTDWPAVVEALRRSALPSADGVRARRLDGLWRLVSREGASSAVGSPAALDALRTAVQGVAAGLRHVEGEVARLHASMVVLEQVMHAATKRLETALTERERAHDPAAGDRRRPTEIEPTE